MFNRALQVKLIKTTKAKNVNDETLEDNFADKATIMGAVIESGIKKLAMAALAYVVVDTGRQVLVARAYNS